MVQRNFFLSALKGKRRKSRQKSLGKIEFCQIVAAEHKFCLHMCKLDGPLFGAAGKNLDSTTYSSSVDGLRLGGHHSRRILTILSVYNKNKKSERGRRKSRMREWCVLTAKIPGPNLERAQRKRKNGDTVRRIDTTANVFNELNISDLIFSTMIRCCNLFIPLAAFRVRRYDGVKGEHCAHNVG